ncbi:MAG: TIGR03960 family B12-binding radical SAM protein [Firmicutes bacterium]|nr:TIGR03960 family B12-binding radical SAM protein [Bacillota bacterium]
MKGFRLAEIQRPAQYIGKEYNSIVKKWDQVRTKMVFCFPDTYEIGMSHLGLRLLYEAVNKENDLLCERCFAPMEDVRKLLLASETALTALESGRPLADFDVVGFTLQYELSYTNVLDMLNLAKLPLHSKDRVGKPLVIAGGPCAFNPEPLADFIDLFCLGESEEHLPALLRLVSRSIEQGLSKEELLSAATKLPGIYAPAFYRPYYNEKGCFSGFTIKKGMPQSIDKALIHDIDAAPFPKAPILPHTKVVHDRIMLELMRGCSRGCRFCQAGIIYRPLREKQPTVLLKQVDEIARNSGYEDIGLISLSSADYSQIGSLMEELSARYSGCGMGVSLPSLRVDSFSVDLAAAAGKIRKSGLTFAPEAGSQRLRNIINKGVEEQEIISALKSAFIAGYSAVKLYFMIGLPYETMEDIAAIAELCKTIVALYGKNKPSYVKKPLALSLGVASFVPKAHTPFQWCAQDNAEVLRTKQRYLLNLIRPIKQVSLSYHDVDTSLLEAALARGDRRLGDVLLKAWQMGCHADGWTESFNFQRWQAAFAACNLSLEEFACRNYEKNDVLPWQHIESGVSREWLWREYELAAQQGTTEDCRFDSCSGCGVCQKLDCRPHKAKPLLQIMPESAANSVSANTLSIAKAKQRWRVRLSVTEPACWLSQLDILTAFEKAVRRSALPIAYSQGFNPHMLISWGPAHAVGLCGDSEYTDLVFNEAVPHDWLTRLNGVLPLGLHLLAAAPIAENTPALMKIIDRADYSLELKGELDSRKLEQAIADFMAMQNYMVVRNSPKGKKMVDIRLCLHSLTHHDNNLLFSCLLHSGALIKPSELIQVLAQKAYVGGYYRTAMYIKGEKLEIIGCDFY